MKLLLVDDDAVLTRAYRDRLSAHGFRVNTAATVPAAQSILRSSKPDLVVLDLMLPQVSGVELLRYIRSDAKFAKTPVVVLTNNFGNNFGRQAATLGIEKAFLKADCSPTVLMAAIDEIMRPPLATAPTPEPEAEPEMLLDVAQAEPAPTATPDPEEPVASNESGDGAGASLLADASAICAGLVRGFEDLARDSRMGPEQEEYLQDLICQVHCLAATAGQTGLGRLAQATTLLDALLMALMGNPERLGPSVLRTVGSLVEAVQLLFQQAREPDLRAALDARVLVVGGEPLANQKVVAALRSGQVDAWTTEHSLVAWQWINDEHFDLVVLDVEMPVLDGLELCERLRTLPGHEKTPVILVTAHGDLDTRSGSIASGANDLITKPILPQELAAKVLLQLIRTQL